MKSARPAADEAANPLFSSPAPPAQIIPDHELLQRIGSGAYGEVWRARNVMGELRAVKVIYRSRFNDARPFEREFEGIRRFEPISRSHPSQLAILHVGKNDDAGCFYYVMELADGVGAVSSSEFHVSSFQTPTDGHQHETRNPKPETYSPHTLRHDLDERERLPIPDCIQIGLSLTTALAHLHKDGLVHRDIKPSNVIFVNGVPKLGDIGLVTEAGDTQSIVGTEGYIPPEGPGTPQADIFSLGKVLYEISTGMDRRRFAELPEDLRSWPERKSVIEFNEILLKACAKNPEQRYQSADQMRADLELLRSGHSVKRQRAWQQTWRQGKRLALAICAVAAVTIIAYWLSDLRSHPSDSARSGQLDFTWSTNEEANEEFRSGMRFLQDGKSREAVQYFQRTTELDPNFADAYAYLARAWMAFSGASNQYLNASMAAYKAVSLDTNSALGHSVLGTAKLYELDWAGADAARKRALALAPNSEDILLTSALNLATMGRSNEALADLEKARRVAPGSASHARTLYSGYVFAWSGQYDRALCFNQMTNASYWVKGQHAQAYLAKDDYPNAMRLERQAALKTPGADANQVNKEFDALENAFKEGGKDEYWKRKLEFETSKTDEEHWMRLAAIHARLNQREKAFEYLRRARQRHLRTSPRE